MGRQRTDLLDGACVVHVSEREGTIEEAEDYGYKAFRVYERNGETSHRLSAVVSRICLSSVDLHRALVVSQYSNSGRMASVHC